MKLKEKLVVNLVQLVKIQLISHKDVSLNPAVDVRTSLVSLRDPIQLNFFT